MNIADMNELEGSVKSRRFAVLFLIIVPIMIFGAYIWRFAVNVPFIDDFDLLSCINDLKENPSAFFEIMLRQLNDHRPFVSRVGAIMSYALTGNLDFRVMKLLGFFNLVWLCLLFYRIYRKSDSFIMGFAPVVFLLFSPVVYGDHLYALTSFQHVLSIVFAIITFNFLQPEKKKWWYWSMPFAVMSTLGLLDGLSVIPLGLLWLILQQRRRESIWFATFSVLYVFVFFQGFHFSGATKAIELKQLIPLAGSAFLAFLGGFFSVFSDSLRLQMSVAGGILILVIFVAVQVVKWLKNIRLLTISKALAVQFDVVDMVALWFVAAAAMIGLGRAFDGPEGVLGARFMLHIVCVLVVIYLVLLRALDHKLRRILMVAALVFSMLSWAFIYIKYDPLVRIMEAEHKTDSFNYTRHQVFLHQYFDMRELGPSFYRNYRFPEFFSTKAVSMWKSDLATAGGKGDYRMGVHPVGNSGRYSKFYFPVTEVELDNIPSSVPSTEAYLGIMSNSNPQFFYLVALRDLNNSWKNQFFGKESNRKFFVSIIGKVHKGVYHAGICWVQNGEPKMLPVSGSLSMGF